MAAILFRVTTPAVEGTRHRHRVICWADTREAAKRLAHDYLGGNADEYEVEPLTNRGDTVHFRATLYA